MFLTWLDLRIATRRLGRAPGFSAAAVLLLAISIGGSIFVFSAVRTLLLQSIPYSHPERLAVLSPEAPRWDLFQELRDGPAVFDRLGTYTRRAANLTGRGPAERVLIGRVSPEFLPIVGQHPVVGRLFRDEEFDPPHDRVAVITTRLWRQRYGSATDVIGQTLTLDGLQYTIVGVLPPEFKTVEQLERAHGLPFDRDVSLLLPLPDRAPRDPMSTDNVERGLTVVGRLRDGMSVEQANRELAAVLAGAQLRYQYPVPFAFISLRTAAVRGLPTQLTIVSIAVALFLLVGCANVTNLVLARIEARRRELAVCMAIGSNARRIVASVLAETLLLSSAGGVLGLLVAWQSLTAMAAAVGSMLDGVAGRVDLPMVAFTAAMSLGTGVVVGIGPALRHAHTDPALALQRSIKRSVRGGAPSFTSVLVAVQVALAVVLVVVGALLAQTLVRAISVTPGFGTKDILTAEISLDRSGYRRRNATRFFTELLERLAAERDVQGAALVSTLPGGEFQGGTGAIVRGRVHMVDAGTVSPAYFSVLSIPVIAGTSFQEEDSTKTPLVVVVNETFARMFWGTADRALGETVAMGERVSYSGTGKIMSAIEWTIIGVVADSRDGAGTATVKPKVYWSYKQGSSLGSTQMTLLVHASSGNAAAIAQPLRRLVAEMNSDQPVYNVLPLEDILRSRFAREWAMATVMNAFAILTLVVAVLGVHAAMAYTGACRRHEIGVRLALGGSRVTILRSLAWRCGQPVLAGMEAGILLAVISVSFLRAWLFGTGTFDVSTMIFAVGLVTVVSGIALIAPAWHATQVDPIETLRAE